MSKKTVIISAFPGMGKSVAYMQLKDKIKILDSDSSKFDKTDFPKNYIEHMKENMGEADIIFVSSHESVREAMIENGIRFICYYPSKDRKKEFLKNYKDRGNNEKFIKFLTDNFDKFIDEIDNDKRFDKIKLSGNGCFIMDDFHFNEVLKAIK
jgi:hypothetical protein